MIPDHANPTRVPPPIDPPAMTRAGIYAALWRMGFEDIRLEALACNPMKYRAVAFATWVDRPLMVMVEELSWAKTLASIHAQLDSVGVVLPIGGSS